MEKELIERVRELEESNLKLKMNLKLTSITILVIALCFSYKCYLEHVTFKSNWDFMHLDKKGLSFFNFDAGKYSGIDLDSLELADDKMGIARISLNRDNSQTFELRNTFSEATSETHTATVGFYNRNDCSALTMRNEGIVKLEAEINPSLKLTSKNKGSFEVKFNEDGSPFLMLRNSHGLQCELTIEDILKIKR